MDILDGRDVRFGKIDDGIVWTKSPLYNANLKINVQREAIGIVCEAKGPDCGTPIDVKLAVPFVHQFFYLYF